jgi:hypothetical protein
MKHFIVIPAFLLNPDSSSLAGQAAAIPFTQI